MQYTRSTIFIATAIYSSSVFSLSELSDEELSEISGQATLFDVDKYDYAGNNFYQIKINSTISSSVNIQELDLKDASGNSQIKMNNLSLNGGDAAGVSSMQFQNPFIEFAFAGSIDDSTHNARNREIIGVRIGADNMDGFMSIGNQAAVPASQSPTGSAIAEEQGLEFFRGYMKTAPVTGVFTTLDSAGNFQTNLNSVGGFRNGPPGQEFLVTGNACIDGALTLGAFANGACGSWNDVASPFTIANANMKFASVVVDNNYSDPNVNGAITILAGGHEINTSDGVPISKTTISTDILPLPDIAFEMTGSATALAAGFLPITLPNTLGTGTLRGLRTQASVEQDLRYIHKIQLTGQNSLTLSAQNRDLQWRGDPVMARQGWWMAVGNPVELGDLTISGVVIPDASLVQITQAASNLLWTPSASNPQVPLPLPFSSVGGIFGVQVNVPVGNLDFNNSTAPISINLTESQSLGPNQAEIRNCWNGALGC